jgi:1,2-diacylglycerol 3-alpha-glucosyltransferase
LNRDLDGSGRRDRPGFRVRAPYRGKTVSRDRLDILYVGTLPPQAGGAAIVGVQLLQRLAARGHAVRALAPIAPAADSTRVDFSNVRVTWFPVPRYESAPDVPPDAEFARAERAHITTKLPCMIREARPDVVVIGRESFVRHVPPIARTYEVPSLMLVHGDPTRSLIQGTYPEPHASRLLVRYRQVDGIATPGRHMAAGLRRMDLRRITVIPNAIDLDQFMPRARDPLLLSDLRIPNHCRVILHASKLEKGKRAQDIVDSAERVLALHRDLVYVIAGHGPCRDSLEDACRRNGLADRFRFVGWIDHRHMPRYVNLADVVLMPSEAETQALIYLETQACARLLVASDIPAAREVVVDGETGLLFRKGDIDDLVATTLRALGDPLLRARIGRTARTRVERHDLDVMTTSYEDLLRRIAGRRPTQRERSEKAPAQGRGRRARPECPRNGT